MLFLCFDDIFYYYLDSFLLPAAPPSILPGRHPEQCRHRHTRRFRHGLLGQMAAGKIRRRRVCCAPVVIKNQGNKPAAVSPVAAFAMIQFRANGRFTGTAGCNQLFGRQQQVYPNFSLDPIGATRMAHPTSAERLFIDALSVMTKARWADEILILSNNSGRELLFSRY